MLNSRGVRTQGGNINFFPENRGFKTADFGQTKDHLPIFCAPLQGKGSNCDLFTNTCLFQKGFLSLTLENVPLTPIVKMFNSTILSCHTWNIPKKCPSRIYKQWKSDWDTSWEWRCWNFYNGYSILPYLLQWPWFILLQQILDVGSNPYFWIQPDLIYNPDLLCDLDLYFFCSLVWIEKDEQLLANVTFTCYGYNS